MNLESVIQSEVSQKDKSKYHVLMHICGIWGNGIDDLIRKAGTETQRQRMNVWIPRGEGWGGRSWETWTDTST